MSSLRRLQYSFSGGEVTPELFGRVDDPKYQSGLATCRNFVTKPHGPAENRAGFAYVREVKDSTKATRLLPFTYNTDQTMVIELGAGYFRFHTQGATLLNLGAIYEIANTYAEEDLFDIHYVQSADVMTLVHPNYPPKELRRLAANDWRLVDVSLSPTISAPTSPVATPSAVDATYTYDYVITAISADGQSESEPTASATCTGNLFTTGFTITVSWTGVPGASRYNVYKLQGGIHGFIGSTTGVSIVDDNIAPDMGITPPIYDGVFGVAGEIVSVAVTAGGAGYDTSIGGAITAVALETSARYVVQPTAVNVIDLAGTGAGATVNVTWSFFPLGTGYYFISAISLTAGGSGYGAPALQIVGGTFLEGINKLNWTVDPIVRTTLAVTDVGGGTGASLSPVIVAGAITGVVVENPGQGYVSPVVSVSAAAGGAGATFDVPVLTTSGDYPAAVSYFEQRRCFAGTPRRPQTIWMTASGTESDMSYSLPVKDDDRISFRVAAREASPIRHIVPLTQLLLLTSSAEWRVSSLNSDAITPSTIIVRPQSYIGASNVQPCIINNALVYASERGGHVRECAYNWQANGFITGDLSIRAPHLFDNLNVVDMAYAKAPYPVVWFVSSNGRLLGLTYVPEQAVGGWHWHDTDGLFESVAVVAEGDEDVLYAVIKREVNGLTVRYVERMATRLFAEQEDAFFVDSGLSYDGTNTSATTITISGGTTWGPGEDLTLMASAATFTTGTPDVGDAIVFPYNGIDYILTISAVTSTTEATAWVDQILPAGLQGVATATWGFARNSVGGLAHLEGKTVSILTDGAVHPQRVVNGGEIGLDYPAVKIHAGLPFVSDLQTMPLSAALRDGSFGQGHAKNINKVWLRVYRSSGIFAGPDFDNLTEAKIRTTEPYGTPPALKSEEIELVISPSWNQHGHVCVRQTDPLPLTVASITLEASIGG